MTGCSWDDETLQSKRFYLPDNHVSSLANWKYEQLDMQARLEKAVSLSFHHRFNESQVYISVEACNKQWKHLFLHLHSMTDCGYSTDRTLLPTFITNLPTKSSKA